MPSPVYWANSNAKPCIVDKFSITTGTRVFYVPSVCSDCVELEKILRMQGLLEYGKQLYNMDIVVISINTPMDITSVDMTIQTCIPVYPYLSLHVRNLFTDKVATWRLVMPVVKKGGYLGRDSTISQQ